MPFVFAAGKPNASAGDATINTTDSTGGKEAGKDMKNAIDKLMMFSLAVSDMPKAREFYVDKLGLKVVNDFRRDDHNWWVSLAFPEGGPSITLTTAHENMKPGAMKMYFATSDIAAARRELSAKGAAVSEVRDDLYGPGSGVKWFSVEDPDGDQILMVQSAR